MKKIPVILTFLFILTLAPSCEKDDIGLELSYLDYLIFGRFYGECNGEHCIEIYRLEMDCLLEDQNDQYPNAYNFYEGNFLYLGQSLFNRVKDLPRYFPNKLLSEPEHVIGQPDAGDWGGLYIEYNYYGDRRFWLIDNKRDNVPEYLHEFIDKVNERIDEIHKKPED
jgi:hypothetical protein